MNYQVGEEVFVYDGSDIIADTKIIDIGLNYIKTSNGI